VILDEIAARTRIRVEAAKERRPLEQLRDAVETAAAVSAVTNSDTAGGAGGSTGLEGASAGGLASFPFEAALAVPGLSFICEVKKASPSKGLIAADFPYLDIGRDYEAAGAAAVSVLTEPEYFLGSDDYLREIAAALSIPVLRKDFIIDTYQIYEAKLLGAQALLLICALLDTKTLAAYIKLAHSLGLSALVETHSEDEVRSALDAGGRIIGVNNRDLRTFKVDLGVTGRLRKLIPTGLITVSESGIRGPEDIRALGGSVDAVLIGETLMRAVDKRQYLRELREAWSRA
jgi:indole-3-glycerol phosphate synthase